MRLFITLVLLLPALCALADEPDSLLCTLERSYPREELSAVLRNLYQSAGECDVAVAETADSLAAGPVRSSDVARLLPVDEEVVIVSLSREQVLSAFGSDLGMAGARVVFVAVGAALAADLTERLALPPTRAQHTGRHARALLEGWLRQ